MIAMTVKTMKLVTNSEWNSLRFRFRQPRQGRSVVVWPYVDLRLRCRARLSPRLRRDVCRDWRSGAAAAARITAASIWPSTRTTSRSTLAIWPRRSQARCVEARSSRFSRANGCGERLRSRKSRKQREAKQTSIRAAARFARGPSSSPCPSFVSSIGLGSPPQWFKLQPRSATSFSRSDVLRPGSTERVRRTRR